MGLELFEDQYIGLLDSYPKETVSAYRDLYSGSVTRYGQSFYNSKSRVIKMATVFAKYIGDGSQTGDIYAKIYAHTGTFGSTGTPTGSVLATSLPFPASLLTSSGALIDLPFEEDQQITLSAVTYYCLVFEYTGGDASNHIAIGYDGVMYPNQDDGNSYTSTDGSTWTYVSTEDCCFYIYFVLTLKELEYRVRTIEQYLGLT